jgi:hypothetical protein
MTDCADLGNCVIPMWFQYTILAVAFLLFLVKVTTPRDPYDRM